jgi:DNA polymerase (family 10)
MNTQTTLSEEVEFDPFAPMSPVAMVTLPPMTNREMAQILFNIASVLREEGNINSYRTRAYERAARALMGYPDQAFRMVDENQNVPFHRRWHIGKKLNAKIREMVQSGQLTQYFGLLDTQAPHRRELMRVPGIGPKTADRIHHALGIRTRGELIGAARDGRLQFVPGFGPRRTRQIAALEVPDVRPFNLFQQ